MKFFEEKTVKTEREPVEMLRVVRQELTYMAESCTKMAAFKPGTRLFADAINAKVPDVAAIENKLESGQDFEPKAPRTAPAA